MTYPLKSSGLTYNFSNKNGNTAMPKPDEIDMPKTKTTEPKTIAAIPDLNSLVMSLAPYVTAADIGQDRKEFLRSVAGRILDDLGF
jgi:hypothetical protein